MGAHSGAVEAGTTRPEWFRALSKHEHPNTWKAIWQLFNTFIPYGFLWYLMVRILRQGYPYWMALALAPVAAGLLVRIFIFFHDCGHGSFFRSRRANRILGYLCGILTFTPYEDWRRAHSLHHASAGDLDRRGTGDVWTMTVQEYLAAPRWKRFAYRAYRHPLITFVVGPAFVFLIGERFSHAGARRRERYSVWFTNLALLAIVLLASVTIGLRTYLTIQLPILLMADAAGVWLFYVQHQFEGVYWARHAEWKPMRAALEGSSHYKLPVVLQWFTGNIGLHHVHHARPRIPNYNLQRCYDETPALQAVVPLTLRTSLRCLFLHLWDERERKLVSFRSLKALPAQS